MKTKWQKRWCIIRGSNFIYYKKKDGQQKGQINLKACHSIKSVGDYKKKGGCFQIVTPAKTYHLFSCDGDNKAWVTALNDAKNGEKGDSTETSKPASPKPSAASPKVEEDKSNKMKPESKSSDRAPVKSLTLKQISSLKEMIPFLVEEGSESKILEFHAIWMESFPEIDDSQWTQNKCQFKLCVSSNFNHISWAISGQQPKVIQKMVDFFWNVGAPESEIDKLNDVGAICNPPTVGSWIDMSNKGGMDGGWYFPVEIALDKALEAADKGHEDFQTLKKWIDKHGFTTCYSVKRDMGAAPPRQTELKFKLPGSDFDTQCQLVKESIAAFDFPDIPQSTWDIITEAKVPGVRFSIIITDEGFARVGALFPKPTHAMVRRLCTGDHAVLESLETVLGEPTYVEYFNLNSGFGYGVYTTGHSVGFHYAINGPDSFNE